MFRAGFETGGDREQLGVGHAVGGQQIADGRRAARERAGLVERQDLDAAGGLQRRGIVDQDAEPRAAARADHHGGRRREPECAGAGDHEHGDGVDHPRDGVAAPQPPAEEGEHAERRDDRDEHAGHAIREALHRCLRRLGVLDEPGDARELGVAADARRADRQGTLFVAGRGEHAIPGGLADRDAFAGQHGLGHRRTSFEDDAVDGHLFAGSDDHDVAGLEFGDPDLDEVVAAADPRRARLHA